mgnify:CR=1 FL=1
MGKKLLSAHTFGNERGEFDNFYNDEIFIEKDSEIAVHSCCLEIDNLKIRIDENSDLLRYTIVQGSTNSSARVMSLPHGEYSQDNINDLLLLIKNSLNRHLNADTEISAEWLIETIVDPNNKQNNKKLVFRLSDRKKYTAQIGASNENLNSDNYEFSNNILIQDSGLGNAIVRNGNQNPTALMEQICVGKIRICRGSCQTGVKLLALPPVNSLANDSGFVLGWGDARHDFIRYPKHKAFLRYYVRCPPMLGTTAFYFYKEKDGNEELSNVQVLIGDTIQIELSEGNVRGVVYRLAGGVDREILFSDPYPYNFGDLPNEDIDLKPVLAIFGVKTSMEVNGLYYHANPYSSITNRNVKDTASFTLTQDPPVHASASMRFTLTFQNINMANQFGYESLTPNSVSKGTTGNVASDDLECRAVNSFFRKHHGSNFKIEMLNLMIDSYDSLTAGRKNIICVIPVEDEFISSQKSRINFQPENIIYLSIKNQERLSLRNIKCRLLDGLNNAVGLVDFSSINFIINDS